MFQAIEKVFNTTILRKDGTVIVDDNSIPNPPGTVTKLIPKQYLDLMHDIRELYQIAGGVVFYSPYKQFNHVKSLDGLVVDFHKNNPERLYTPEGNYIILGSHIHGDTDKFWRLLNEKFELTPVKPIIEWSESFTQSDCYMRIVKKTASEE